MGDTVLANNYGAVGQTGCNVMSEVAVDGWNNADQMVRNTTYATEQVDGRFKAATEKTGTSQKEIPNAGGGEVKSRNWGSRTFENFEVEKV